jgi:hypothetical protein
MCRTIWLLALLPASLLALGVAERPALPQAKGPEKKAAAKKAPPAKKVRVGRHVFVEVENKKVARVLVEAYVCLRKGSLEHLLTRRLCKEHEAILAADIDARDLHSALLLAGAEVGTPVVFKPWEAPPRGTRVKISLAYKDKGGKAVKVPAQRWIRHATTKLDLACDWVFVGSAFVVNSGDPAEVHYLANQGDVICVANFESALLDMPIWSPATGENDYEAHTERIPPLETPVLVILEPVRPKKK